MEIPISSNCLTTIVEVYHEFLYFLEANSTIPTLGEKRDLTEVYLDSESSDSRIFQTEDDLPKRDWYLSLVNALQTLQQNVSSEIDLNSFTFEEIKIVSLSKDHLFQSSKSFHGSMARPNLGSARR